MAKNLDKQNISEDKAIAQCIFQMVICKINSIISLIEGISIIPNQKSFKIVDTYSIYSILRNLYETIFIFKNIFIMPDNGEERRILLNLWIIRGLYNRQNWDYTPDKYKGKQKIEQKEIQKLKDEIYKQIVNIRITESEKKQIEYALDKETTKLKGYKFRKDIDGVITSIESISLEDSPYILLGNKKYKKLYTLMSLKSHPSYLGTLQFGQMYNNNLIFKELKFILESCCIFTSIFIYDFCLFTDIQIYLEKQPKVSQDIILYFRSII